MEDWGGGGEGYSLCDPHNGAKQDSLQRAVGHPKLLLPPAQWPPAVSSVSLYLPKYIYIYTHTHIHVYLPFTELYTSFFSHSESVPHYNYYSAL
jgi:hypothetical protein